MRKGITLIMLTVTIIVLSLLTAVVVMEIMDNDIQEKAYTTVFRTDLNMFISEFDIKKANRQMIDISFDETTINATWDGINNSSIVTWIPSFTEEYKDKLIIQNGAIVYTGSDEAEQAIIEQLHLDSYYNIVVPNTYTQLEYISTDATAYIDTGYVPNENTRLVAKYALNDTERRTSQTIATHDAEGEANYFGFAISTTGVFNIYSGSTYSYTTVNIDTNFHIHDFDYPNLIYRIDGAPSGAIVASYHYTGTYPMYIGLSNRNGEPSSTSIQGRAIRISYVQIYNNGVLVKNMIPAKRNNDLVVGLYDTVNNTFFTKSGDGTLTAGPTVF